MFGKQKKIIKEYRGNEAQARGLYIKDSLKKEKEGYIPFSENFSPGAYTTGNFILAALLCFVLIGFIVFVYMLIVKPKGTLTVTYAYQDKKAKAAAAEKNCTECGEAIKQAAKKCRFCNYQFETAST